MKLKDFIKALNKVDELKMLEEHLYDAKWELEKGRGYDDGPSLRKQIRDLKLQIKTLENEDV